MQALLHARDVATLLGLTTSTVLDRFEAGDIPGFRLYGRKGGPVRFRKEDLDVWLETTCRVGTVPTSENRPGRGDAPAPTPEGTASDANQILRSLEPE
jgi:excisionase family DNA binding protein